MAYTATVTKQNVSKVSEHIFSVSIDVVVNDGVSDVFEAAVSAQYNDQEADLEGIKARMLTELRNKWDKWAAEHQIFSAATFDTMVGQIQMAATAYINQ